jgi:hypothetical protein
MVSDYEHTVEALARVAGLRVLEYSANEVIGRRGGMAWIGDNSVEVAQPIVDGHAADRFLRAFGPGMHSYAFEVEDLDATVVHLEGHGIKVGVRPEPGFCFTDPRTTGSLLFEWADMAVPEDPRHGGACPPYSVDPLLDVRTHAFVGAVVDDPVRWAEAYGDVFGLTEAFRNPFAAPGLPAVGLAAPDCVLALWPLPGGRSRELWGVEHVRARCHVLGLGVPDLRAAVRKLDGAGIRVLRHADGFAVIEPNATGQVPLMLMEGLLPGDPRSPSARPPSSDGDGTL